MNVITSETRFENKIVCDCTTCIKSDVCMKMEEYKNLISKVKELYPSGTDFHFIIQCKYKAENNLFIKR